MKRGRRGKALTFLVGAIRHDQVQDVGVQVLVLRSQDAEHQVGAQLNALILILVDSLHHTGRAPCHMARHVMSGGVY